MISIFLAKYLILVFPFFLSYLLLKKENKIVFIAALAALLAKLAEVIVGIFYFVPRPFVVNSKLPYYNKGQSLLLSILGDGNLANDSSFFSAHAATAFAVAVVIYLTYKKGTGIIMLICASLVGIGRVWANVHYPIDVAAGAGAGILIGLTSSTLYVKLLK